MKTEKDNGMNDEELVKHFLAPGRKEIADNGFTRRVMSRLPERERERHAQRIARWWTVACISLALAWFIRQDGIRQIWEALLEVFGNMMQSSQENIDTQALITVCIVLLLLGFRKIASLT